MGVRQTEKRLRTHSRAGQSLVEYTLILLCVSVAVLAILISTGSGVNRGLDHVNTNLQ